MFEVGRKYGIIPIIVTKERTKVIMHRKPSDEIKYKKPIVLNALYDTSYYTWDLSNEELEIYGCGFSIDEALLDAEACLRVLVEEYLLESDDKLSDKALKLKRKLSEYVEVVE